MRFIFQHNSPFGKQFFHQYCCVCIPLVKKLSTADMASSYKLFSL